MKAKFKPLIILIAVFICSLVAGVIAGCSIGEETPKDFADKQGLTCPVTYYTNGGNFKLGNDKVSASYRTIYFKPDTPILNITDVGSTTSTPKLSIGRDGYLFLGWRYCLLENGKPILSADEAGNERLPYLDNGQDSGTADIQQGGVQISESRKVFYAQTDPESNEVFQDGKVIIGSGEHLFLVAQWEKDVEIKYLLDIAEGETMKVKVGDTEQEWKDGDVISTTMFGRFNELELDPAKEPKYNVNIDNDVTVRVTSHSYISLYKQKGGVEPILKGVNDRYSKPTDKQDIIIYARYFEGTDWTSVRDADDVNNMLGHRGTPVKYFIVTDINCSGKSIIPKGNREFRDSIDGNNCTISNIKVTERNPGAGEEISLFGKLASGVEIKNLTVENIEYEKISISKGPAPLHIIFASKEGDVKLENFKVSGEIKAVVVRNIASKETAISNLEQEGEIYKSNLDSWLGGTSYKSNTEFTAQCGGEGLKLYLTIDDEIIVGDDIDKIQEV